jgi:peptidoglycan hydrolase-like protein with peptidoglycan-binding domain
MNKKNTMKSLFSLAILVSFLSPMAASAEMLTRQLSIGARGTDVTSLQSFLATNPDIYPQGKVTGYFGFLTKAAVSNFQKENGLAADGIAGRNSIPVINAQMANGMMGATAAPVVSNVYVSPSRNSATINWNTDQSSKGVVYYSTTPFVLTDNINSVDVYGGTYAMNDNMMRTSQSMNLVGLQAGTMYYYFVYVTSSTGVVSMSWPTTFQTTN